MNFLDKLSLAAIGISICALAYDDISQEVAETFDGLFEASASIPPKEYRNYLKDDIYLCDEKGDNCIDLLERAFKSLDDKPKKPLKRYSKKDVQCLAANIYHEASIEPLSGQLAVAFGTIQRVKDKRFPDSLCGVVYQKRQMSWTANAKKRLKSVPLLYRSIAQDVLNGRYVPPSKCPATNWYNPIDTRGSFNEMQFVKGKTVCTYTISRHTYIAYR